MVAGHLAVYQRMIDDQAGRSTVGDGRAAVASAGAIAEMADEEHRSGAIAFFLLLQSVLGVHPDAPLGRLTIRNPRLPDFLRRVDLEGMRVGGARVSLHFARHSGQTHVDLVDVQGDQRLKVNIEIE